MSGGRDHNGHFIKGNSIATGRPKGSKNVVTEKIRLAFLNFINDNLDTMQEDFDHLDPKDRFEVIFKLSKFILPTLKTIEFGNVLDEMSESDFQKLIHKLKSEQLN